MSLHELQHFVERFLCNNRIGIEQQHILALALANTHVVGAGKTQVVATLDNAHSGIMLTDICHSIVLRLIVNHHDFRVNALHRLLYALQTLVNILPDIIADYDDC